MAPAESGTPPPRYVIPQAHQLSESYQNHVASSTIPVSFPRVNSSVSVQHTSLPEAPSSGCQIGYFCVPRLPIPDHSAENSLDDILHQWENAVPVLGLPVALKDWPHDWYNGINREKFGAMYNIRKQIALEYIDRYVHYILFDCMIYFFLHQI